MTATISSAAVPHRIARLFTLAIMVVLSAGPERVSAQHIAVDVFGYPPAGEKIAFLREAVTGFDAPDPYTPGPTIELRRTSDNVVVHTMVPTPWMGGAVHDQSGDRVWWADFTSFATPGAYYVHDPATGLSSEPFVIDAAVYQDAATAAVRMFYYQRCGCAKAPEHAGAAWSDTTCHLGSEQDLDCRFVLDPSPATSRDLAGGWHDAGDYNKYVNFADDAVHDLLHAYSVGPAGWGDASGIPESGNGIPDLLDEVRYEMTWLLKMQNTDGSLIHKVSVTDFSAASPASADSGPRRYASATASATISGAGIYAHAAEIFATLPDAGSQAFAQELETAAIAAWDWVAANPAAFPSFYANDGGAFVNASAEDSPYEQEMNRLRAAVHLYRLTGVASYRLYVEANYGDMHLFQWGYAIPYEQGLHETILLFAATPGVSPAVSTAINNTYLAAAEHPDHLGSYTSSADAYRAFLFEADHVWGSNRVRSDQGCLFTSVPGYGLATDQVWRDAGAGFLHYLHGANPFARTYLTSMAGAGGDSSMTEMYHAWFADGTVWDSSVTSLYGPPPGFLTGGPNFYFAPDPAYAGPPLTPPQDQPAQKSYRDWNAGWPEASWQVSECHIPYQAGYIRLLAEFLPAILPGDVDGDGVVGVLDVLAVLADWGPCPPDCPADVNGDGAVNVLDVLAVLAAWS